MIEKNQELEVEIESYASEGQGVARHNGFVIFVPMAIVGEVIKVHIIKVTKSYAVGKIIDIVKPSKARCNPKCLVFGKCGGCSLQHVTYEETVNIKKQIVEDAFIKIAGLNNICVNDVVKSENIYNYRNKSAFPLCVVNDKLEVCMYRTSSHNPVVIGNCAISYDIINKCAEIFKNYANKNFKVSELVNFRHLVIRVIENKLLITIVSDKPLKNVTSLYFGLLTKLNLSEGSLGLFWCKKSLDNNVILEGTIKHLLGVNQINAEILGVNVSVSPLSFFQVNFDIMNLIYQKVQNSISNNEVVVDAYSGAGLMSALIAKKAKHVYGIEIVEDATKNANTLKEVNQISNLTNINGDMNIELPRLLSKIKKIDVLVVDPPRKGIDNSVLETIMRMSPSKIIYVSCNPATLARDVKLLLEKYTVKEIQPYDMFPQTSHVETFVVLEKK